MWKTLSSLSAIFAVSLLAQFLYFTTWIVPVYDVSVVICGLLIFRKYVCRAILGWNCWLACCAVKPLTVLTFVFFSSMEILLALGSIKRAGSFCLVHTYNDFSFSRLCRRLFTAKKLCQELKTWTFFQLLLLLRLGANRLATNIRRFINLDINLTFLLWLSLKHW